MTNSSPWYRWPIEIDGLPIKNGDFAMAMLNNQRVYVYNYIYIYNSDISTVKHGETQPTHISLGRNGGTVRNGQKLWSFTSAGG